MWCIWQGKKYKLRFFSRKMTFRKEQNNCSFCGESHSSCSQNEQFFCPFLMHLARQKVKWRSFWKTLRKEQKIWHLFWIWQGKKYKLRSFLERYVQKEQNNCFLWWEPFSVFKRNNLFVLFWCIWQGKKYKWRFLERNKKNCSFCGESHSSCSQKEQFFVLFWCIWQGKKYKLRSFF